MFTHNSPYGINESVAGSALLGAAVCALACVAAASASASASCSGDKSTAADSDERAEHASDMDARKADSSTERFFMEPINALRKAAAVLSYNTPDAPPAIHTPKPPEGPLPRLQYPVVLVHGFLGEHGCSHTRPLCISLHCHRVPGWR